MWKLIIGLLLYIPFEILWLSLDGILHWQAIPACFGSFMIGIGIAELAFPSIK